MRPYKDKTDKELNILFEIDRHLIGNLEVRNKYAWSEMMIRHYERAN